MVQSVRLAKSSVSSFRVATATAASSPATSGQPFDSATRASNRAPSRSELLEWWADRRTLPSARGTWTSGPRTSATPRNARSTGSVEFVRLRVRWSVRTAVRPAVSSQSRYQRSSRRSASGSQSGTSWARSRRLATVGGTSCLVMKDQPQVGGVWPAVRRGEKKRMAPVAQVRSQREAPRGPFPVGRLKAWTLADIPHSTGMLLSTPGAETPARDIPPASLHFAAKAASRNCGLQWGHGNRRGTRAGR